MPNQAGRRPPRLPEPAPANSVAPLKLCFRTVELDVSCGNAIMRNKGEQNAKHQNG